MTWLLIPFAVIIAAPIIVGAFFAATKGDPPPYPGDDLDAELRDLCGDGDQ